MDFSDFNITIVGLGLIGGSLAMSIKKKLNPKNLWGIDVNTNVLDHAESTNIIDRGFLSAREPLQKSDIVFICIYPRETVEFVKEHMDNFKHGAIIIDAAGIKVPLLSAIAPVLRDDIDYISCHPMAGRESKGLEFAGDNIFEGADYIITPTEKNKPENIELIKEIAKILGFGNAVCINPCLHDDMIAFVSHLPHIIAASIVLDPIMAEETLYTGGSFRDMTRVARINPDLWAQLLLDNSEYVLKHLKIFKDNVGDFEEAINKNDYSRLKFLLTKACERKESFDLGADTRNKSER